MDGMDQSLKLELQMNTTGFGFVSIIVFNVYGFMRTPYVTAGGRRSWDKGRRGPAEGRCDFVAPRVLSQVRGFEPMNKRRAGLFLCAGGINAG